MIRGRTGSKTFGPSGGILQVTDCVTLSVWGKQGVPLALQRLVGGRRREDSKLRPSRGPAEGGGGGNLTA